MTDNGHGAIFKNKTKNVHPDYRGDCTIDGQKYWVSGWIKEGARGKFMSLAFRIADEQQPKLDPHRSGFTEGEIPS
jgi:hypothetical protein